MSFWIGPTFFSNDDSTIAIQTQRGISVFDLRKKTPVRTICCDYETAVLSPDGSLLAAIEPPKHLNPGPLKIFRVADGVVVASHQFATNDSTCRGDGDLCNELVNLVWDPQGRYLVSLETNFALSGAKVHIWWPFAATQTEATITLTDGISHGIAVSPDGLQMAVAQTSQLSFYDIPIVPGASVRPRDGH
jgi:hypothetical protein